jgi:hypothetical protein
MRDVELYRALRSPENPSSRAQRGFPSSQSHVFTSGRPGAEREGHVDRLPMGFKNDE